MWTKERDHIYVWVLHSLVLGLEVSACIAGVFRAEVAVHAMVWIIRRFNGPEHTRIRGQASNTKINYVLFGTNYDVA